MLTFVVACRVSLCLGLDVRPELGLAPAECIRAWAEAPALGALALLAVSVRSLEARGGDALATLQARVLRAAAAAAHSVMHSPIAAAAAA